MPLKKPKPVTLPVPFKDQGESDDSDARRRALLMKRELAQAEGFSWNSPEPRGTIGSLWQIPAHKVWAGLMACGMGALIVSAFFVAADTGVLPPLRIVYVESWRAERTSEDAIAERDEAMDALRARYAEARRLEEARLAAEAQARGEAAERAAARSASPAS